jgi:hypothetical protein
MGSNVSTQPVGLDAKVYGAGTESPKAAQVLAPMVNRSGYVLPDAVMAVRSGAITLLVS